jgi:hypothetical protein
MSDIIDEVITDKKDEQKMLYFKKAIPIIIVGTILIIIGMIINNYRSSNNVKHNQEIGDTIVQSLDNLASNSSLALQGFDFVINNAKNHAKDVAMLHKLAATIQEKDKSLFFEIAEKIIVDKNYLPLTEAYAKLMWISLKLDSPDLLNEDKVKLVKYFDSYTEHTAFYGSAHLLEALWYKKTDKEKSKTILQNLISSKMVTVTVKEEAKALIANLTIEK